MHYLTAVNRPPAPSPWYARNSVMSETQRFPLCGAGTERVNYITFTMTPRLGVHVIVDGLALTRLNACIESRVEWRQKENHSCNSALTTAILHSILATLRSQPHAAHAATTACMGLGSPQGNQVRGHDRAREGI